LRLCPKTRNSVCPCSARAYTFTRFYGKELLKLTTKPKKAQTQPFENAGAKNKAKGVGKEAAAFLGRKDGEVKKTKAGSKTEQAKKRI